MERSQISRMAQRTSLCGTERQSPGSRRREVMRVSVEEKLTAILVADVSGYERLIAHDHARAEAALQLHHHEVIDAAIAVHGGRIFELEPDRTLAEFTSPLAAVRCAVEIQAGLERRMADVPEPERIQLRIGIHYGVALVDGAELSGEALTIGRRVHALAEPGEICVSRTVVEAVGKRLGHGFEDLAGLPARPVPKAGLAFLLRPVPESSPRAATAWLASAGRLVLTAAMAAAAIWLALTEGRPGP
jgi:adenylate cyclase